MQTERTFQPGLNYYVPAMQAAGDLGQALNGRFNFGLAVIAASAALILSAQSIAAAVDTTAFAGGFTNSEAQMGKYGRVLTVVASGAATSSVDVYGRDYLGQKVRETFTLTGTTPVVGKKAMRYVDRVVAGITGGTTINLGVGTGLGLPYVTTKVMSEWIDRVSGTVGTLTAPIFTDPQTAITGDPRGTFVPNTAPNGSRFIEVDVELSNYVNTAGNGGLHGIAHFNS